MAKKTKETKKETPKKEEPKVAVAKHCTCRTEKGFRKNPPCLPDMGCLA